MITVIISSVSVVAGILIGFILGVKCTDMVREKQERERRKRDVIDELEYYDILSKVSSQN